MCIGRLWKRFKAIHFGSVLPSKLSTHLFFFFSLCFAMRFNCVVTTIYCQLPETIEHISIIVVSNTIERTIADRAACTKRSMQQIINKNKKFHRVATTTEQFIDSSHSLFMQSKSDAFVLCNATYIGRPNWGNTHLRWRVCAHTEPKITISCMHVYGAFTLKLLRTHFGDRITDISSPFFHVFFFSECNLRLPTRCARVINRHIECARTFA